MKGNARCVDRRIQTLNWLSQSQNIEWLRQVRLPPRNSCPPLPAMCAASFSTARTLCKLRPGPKPWFARLPRKLGPDAEIIRLHDADLAADPARITVELSTGSLFGGTKIVWLTSCPLKAQAPLAAIAETPLEGGYLVGAGAGHEKGPQAAGGLRSGAPSRGHRFLWRGRAKPQRRHPPARPGRRLRDRRRMPPPSSPRAAIFRRCSRKAKPKSS